jgi:methionyl-tRNA formyltransferase
MRIVMMGTGRFAEPTFRALLDAPHPDDHHVVGLVTQPDRPTGTQRGSTRQTGQSMKNLALKQNLPVYQPENINTPEGVQALSQWQPDLLVVAAFGQILSHDVLATARHGGINVHASLLPKYRGAAPVAWAIFHGEKETGVTVIKMSIYLDAGEMVAQETIPIEPEETAGELEDRLALLGARLASQVVEQIASGTAHGIKQDKSLVTKAPKLTKEHGLIDWGRSAEQVCNQVRAMQPWPTAYTFLHQPGQSTQRLIICKAIARPAGQDVPAPAGTLLTDPKSTAAFLVSAGSEQRSVVEVIELQPAGKRRMTAAEFLRGHAIPPGARLGAEVP